MAHPNVDKYIAMANRFETGDVAGMEDVLAPDVVWHEAGDPEPLRGASAVAARLSSMPAGTTPKVDLRAVLGDDDNVMVVGHAEFVGQDRRISYDYVEHLSVEDGLITERWSYMDAVPADVAAFFAAS